MYTQTSVFVLICVLFFTSCEEKNALYNNSIQTTISNKDENQANNYPKYWERILFKYINERIKETSVKTLREEITASNSKEIRIWVGFNVYPLRGIILRQINEDYSALYFPPLDNSLISKEPIELQPPRSGWKQLWEKLEKSGIYTLPDVSDRVVDNAAPDGTGIVFEVKTSNSYNTFLYGGLERFKTEENRKVSEICNTLSSEFTISLNCTKSDQ